MEVFTHYGPVERLIINSLASNRDIILPESYISLVEEYNGASLVKGSFRYCFLGKEYWDNFSFCRYGIPSLSGGIERFQDQNYVYLAKYLVFGLTACGNYLAFISDDIPDPVSVKLIMHDEYEQGPNGDQRVVIDIAADFDSFLSLLTVFPDIYMP